MSLRDFVRSRQKRILSDFPIDGVQHQNLGVCCRQQLQLADSSERISGPAFATKPTAYEAPAALVATSTWRSSSS